MIHAEATARFIRTSAQKAKLVLDQIRGRGVNHALASLRFSRKLVARDIEKVLRSAIANAQQKEGFGGDVDRLYVSACYANQGPSMKRVRPAPMGRAFRVVKRTAHLTIGLAERPEPVVPAAAGAPAPAAAETRRGKAGKAGAGSGPKATRTRKATAR